MLCRQCTLLSGRWCYVVFTIFCCCCCCAAPHFFSPSGWGGGVWDTESEWAVITFDPSSHHTHFLLASPASISLSLMSRDFASKNIWFIWCHCCAIVYILLLTFFVCSHFLPRGADKRNDVTANEHNFFLPSSFHLTWISFLCILFYNYYHLRRWHELIIIIIIGHGAWQIIPASESGTISWTHDSKVGAGVSARVEKET